ncbi:butyrophilin subfamily 3 member A2 isoform X2 [Lates calcarifer]|uniref:Butyrophilin subfamily 3 member A2 isoform X2 n=1 Tax=Lates calcarifer TaxID=8187 RepID=A0AAJ8DLB0_LATCA|nr:butyrophilin subfamily 3 member A2 isoform X2 [Lates calcarifer]
MFRKLYLAVTTVLFISTLIPRTEQPKVIGSTVKAAVGEDVILPCHLDPPFNVTNLTVEWKFTGNLVHLYRSREDDLTDQHLNFKNRTSLFKDEMVKGNISLKLTNVTENDAGNYTCNVPKLESQVKRDIVTLTVVKGEERVDPNQQVEVEEGVESVQLPFRTTGDLPQDVRVEWTNNDNRMVHVYENGSDRPEEQDQVYRDRTEMKKDLLRTGDLSLTLKHPKVTDTGEYRCVVYNREGNYMRGKTVQLKVKDTENKTYSRCRDRTQDQDQNNANDGGDPTSLRAQQNIPLRAMQSNDNMDNNGDNVNT